MTYKIAVLPGDGIGPEIMKQALGVLEAAASSFSFDYTTTQADVGAIAIDHHGDPLPDSTLAICEDSDAILFGSIGDPKYDNDPNAKVRPEQGLLRLRKSLGLYANIRPVTAYDATIDYSPLRRERIEGVDMVIYRELNSGIYFGEKGRIESEEAAYDVMYYSRKEIERIALPAIEAARSRRKKLTLVDKANVLENSRLWRQTLQRLEAENSDITFDYLFVDNAAMQLILNPAQFDVILTGNMFGDILSDAASVLPGSIGLLASASIGDKTSLYEPVHGSYPQAAGKNIANPTAMILCVAMMLDSLGETKAAQAIQSAVKNALDANMATADINRDNPLSCSAFGQEIARRVKNL